MNEDQLTGAAEREIGIYRNEIERITAERDQYREAVARIRQACERPGDVAGKTSGSGIINGRYLAEHLLRILADLL